jgi:hypothetical protein
LAGLALGAGLLSDSSPNGEKADDEDRITGIRSASDGTDGADAPKPTIRGVTNTSGSIRSVERIEGISTPVLQNLETALRMQEPPTDPQPAGGGGGGSAAAAAELLAPEPVQPTLPDETEDDRDLHVEFSEIETEGS